MTTDITPHPKFLFAVEDTFDITGRGLVIASAPDTQVRHFHNGDLIALKRPDGTVIEHRAYLEMITPNKQNIMALSVPGLVKRDVPKGTEVWIDLSPSKGAETPQWQIREGPHGDAT